ncbi:MAG: hypothetical protein JSV88_08755 [Candidatus Aminicenantes bacterium]|nr:MAG: hypothetical protein JSV88_08755 [Candidatus Aminicenantes bacterium]
MNDQEHKEKVKSRNRERFVRIAENRVNKILDSLESLGNCSNPRNYEYTKEDVEKIFSEIEEKLKEIKSMFLESSPGKKRFKLEV